MERVNARLAVLSAHLEVSDPMPAAIKPWCTSSAGAPHGSLMGNLTIVDERTGKKYQVPVSEDGTVKSIDLKKITTGKDDKGLKLYDPGYLNTAPVRSSISYIDGDEGILRYRGYPIEELAENCTFLEVAYLLIYGNLPSQRQLADLEFEVSQHSAVPQGLLVGGGVERSVVIRRDSTSRRRWKARRWEFRSSRLKSGRFTQIWLQAGVRQCWRTVLALCLCVLPVRLDPGDFSMSWLEDSRGEMWRGPSLVSWISEFGLGKWRLFPDFVLMSGS